MSAIDRDPLTDTAREVLAIQDRHRALNTRTGLDLPIDISDMAALAIAAPDLARAVIDVQAVVEEFAYAATLDRGLSEWEGMCDHFVKLFRDALNGDPR